MYFRRTDRCAESKTLCSSKACAKCMGNHEENKSWAAVSPVKFGAYKWKFVVLNCSAAQTPRRNVEETGTPAALTAADKSAVCSALELL